MTIPTQTQARDQIVDAAALRLLTATDRAQLLEIRELLAPLASDANEPAWVRDALTTAVDLLEQAGSGKADTEGALRRVGTLLELVCTGEAPDTTAPSTSCALPIDSA